MICIHGALGLTQSLWHFQVGAVHGQRNKNQRTEGDKIWPVRPNTALAIIPHGSKERFMAGMESEIIIRGK